SLDGLGVGDGVGAGASTADPLGDLEDVGRGPALGQLLDTAMGVEEARLQMEDGLPDGGEAEMARLDDASVDRADRDLDEALAVQPVELVRLALDPRHGDRWVEILA